MLISVLSADVAALQAFSPEALKEFALALGAQGHMIQVEGCRRDRRVIC